MEIYELLIATVLGLLTMVSALWLLGFKKKPIGIMCLNSAISLIALYLCTEVFSTVLKLNAFTVYLSALFGVIGLGTSYFILA